MEDNYPKAYKEVYEVLKYVPKEELKKIPEKLIKTIEKNMDNNYKFEIDENVNFEEIPLLRETKAIFAVIYRDYWADENEKQRIIAKQKYDIQKQEEEKQKKYSYDDLFKKEKKDMDENVQALVEYKEPTWYMRFRDFIKKIFGKKNI